MERSEMIHRLLVLQNKLFASCYGLFDALNRYNKTFDWLDKCRAYKRAVDELEKRLGM